MHIRCAFVSIACGVNPAAKESNAAATGSFAKSKPWSPPACRFYLIDASVARMVCLVVLMVRLARTRLTGKRSVRRALTNCKRAIAFASKRPVAAAGANPQITQIESLSKQVGSNLRNLWMALRCQAAVDAGQAFWQRQDIVDDRVADFAVEIAQLGFRLAIDRDAEWCDAFVLRLSQRLARVFASVARVAVIVVVRTAVREHDQET